MKFDHPETHNNLTYALLRKGDADAAIAEGRVALNLRPNNADMHVVLGMALMTKGLVDEAIAQFSKALEIRPNYSNAQDNLAVALAEKGEIAGARNGSGVANRATRSTLAAHVNCLGNCFGAFWPTAGHIRIPDAGD